MFTFPRIITRKSCPFSEFLIPSIYGGKKKNKIFVEDSFLREISSPIFTSFGIVKTRRIVAREYFSQLRNELYYPSSKGALSYKVRAKATYKKLREGERERERELKEEEDGARVNPWDFLNVKLAL